MDMNDCNNFSLAEEELAEVHVEDRHGFGIYQEVVWRCGTCYANPDGFVVMTDSEAIRITGRTYHQARAIADRLHSLRIGG